MGSEIEAALADEPWCVGGTLFDMDHVIDDEGRPVNERRAPSRVKQGVAIELKPCPYRDERKGKQMNVSALAQVTRHLDAVLREMLCFRTALGIKEPSWQAVLMPVLDQLAAPAMYLLRRRQPHAEVPAQAAVGHKLAAGFFGVLTGLLSSEVEGRPVAVSSESILRFAHEHRLLLGASEVCAGPPPMIARACNILVMGDCDGTKSFDAARVEIARALSEQICLGLAWESFDCAVERALLREMTESGYFSPKNAYLAGELQRRREVLDDSDGPIRGTLHPRLPVTGLYRALDDALRKQPKPSSNSVKLVLDLVGLSEGAFEVSAAAHAGFAARAAHYLRVYQRFLLAEWELEKSLRRMLAYSISAPMKPSVVVLPRAMAMRWFEAAIGHRLMLGSEFAMRWSSPRRKVRFATTSDDSVVSVLPCPC